MATINISNGLVHSTGAYCLSAGSGGSHIMVHNDYVCVPTLCTGSTANFNDLIVSGNLTVHGTCSILNTTVCTTSAMSITNAGTGPALVVNQTGSQPVVNLLDDGSSVFYIEDGGNVGIGTTNPQHSLEIKSSTPTLFLGSAAPNQVEAGRIRFSEYFGAHGSSFQGAYIHYDGNSNYFKIGTHDCANSSTAQDIDAIYIPRGTQRVGIGRTPVSSCSLSLAAGIYMPSGYQVGWNNGDADIYSSSYSLIFRTYTGSSLTEKMRICGNGNVGIGTTNPVTLMHLYNNIDADDAYGYFQIENGNTTSGSAATNVALTTKNYHGTSQFMQWEEHGLRLGSRITTNSGAGNLYFTTGSDSVGMCLLGSTLCLGGNIVAGSCLAVAGGNSGYLRDVTGDYGSIEIANNPTNGWHGYSINGRAVFMHNNASVAGLYNDVNNQWLVDGDFNGTLRLRYAGAVKLCTTSGGTTIEGNLNLNPLNPTLCWGGNRLYMHTGTSSTIGVVTICKNPNGTAYSPRLEINDSSDATRIQLDSCSSSYSFVCGTFCTDTLRSSGSAIFGPNSIDPDSFGSCSGGFGAISDGSGWNARGLFVHSGITGGAAAIAHGGSCLYFGIQNGSAANSMATWMSVAPNCGKTIWGTTTICGTTNISSSANISGSLCVAGNTCLGNGSGDYTHINDILHVAATDSGDAHFYFGEGSTGGTSYGAYWNWDSGYRHSWCSQNAGTLTMLMTYVTNNLDYLCMGRSLHMGNKAVHYSSEVHFQCGARFRGVDANGIDLCGSSNAYLKLMPGNNPNGFLYSENNGSVGLLDAGGSWAIRHRNDSDTQFFDTQGTIRASIGAESYFCGNVGIGTYDPVTNLHIYCAGSVTATIQSTNNHSNLKLISESSAYSSYIVFSDNSGAANRYFIQADVSDNLLFRPTGTSTTCCWVVFDQQGCVGIGTCNPSAKLDVCGTGTVFSVNGTNGTLFSVEDDLSDSLMSVNDAAGLPVLEVFADSSVCAGRYGCSDFYIASGGNIGIGTTNPNERLEVYNSTDNAGIKITQDGGSGKNPYILMDGESGRAGYIRMDTNGTAASQMNFYASTDTSSRVWSINEGANFGDSTADIMLMQNGQVGIGTNNPQADLHISGSWQNLLQLQQAGVTRALRLSSGSDYAMITHGTDYTTGAYITIRGATGNVGIGTVDPGSCKLLVTGDILAQGWLRTTGATGWYNNTYGGGIYMTDTSYMKFYNSKSLNMCNANIHYVNEVHFCNNLRFCDTGNDNTLYLCSGNASAVRLDLGTQTTRRGSIYADSYNQVGFLDQGGHWAIKHYNDNFTAFYDSNETLRASIGTVHSQFCTGLAVCHDWGSGNHIEQLTIKGTYPSLAFRNTICNGSVWLMHLESAGGDLEFWNAARGQGADSTNWSQRLNLSESGVLCVSSSVQAPIFYDSNNTNCYVDPSSRSMICALNACCVNNYFGVGLWDYVGITGLTNLNMNGHNQFWFGAGNGTWFTGTANSKSQASGLAADATSTHDLLITTMFANSTNDRGITFAADCNGNKNAGWRLGKWHAGDARDSSKLVVDGQFFAKGGYTDEYDYYQDDYSAYYSCQGGQTHWAGDSGYGWNVPSIVASTAIQIQSANAGAATTRKPQIQFHQYGYGGPAIEYDGPNDALCIIGPSSRLSSTGFKYQGNTIWHAGNDGGGSGLNADAVDGLHAASFLRSDTADTFTGTLTMGTQQALVANNYGTGVYGLYSSYRYQHVWSMGTSYNLAGDGTTPSNLYGLAWSHDNTGGQTKPGLGHQLLLMMNGSTYTALGNGIWTTGRFTSNDGGGNNDFRVEAQSTSTGPLGNKEYAIFVDASAGAVGIGTSQPSYALEVNGTAFVTGTFSAGTKNFLIDHPTKENYMLRHGSLEGPENAVYVRGTTTSSSIELPEYWTGLVDEDTITATLTPRGKYLQLFLDRVEDNEIHVGGTEIGELYDYVIYGTRKDVEDLIVEFERPVGS